MLSTVAIGQRGTVQFNPLATEPQILHVGDTFTVKVQAQTGAGYSWDLWKTGREGLAFVGQTSKKATGLIGGPSTVTYSFRATAPGKPVITMVYGRPWELEKGASPVKTLTIPVIIK